MHFFITLVDKRSNNLTGQSPDPGIQKWADSNELLHFALCFFTLIKFHIWYFDDRLERLHIFQSLLFHRAVKPLVHILVSPIAVSFFNNHFLTHQLERTKAPRCCCCNYTDQSLDRNFFTPGWPDSGVYNGIRIEFF